MLGGRDVRLRLWQRYRGGLQDGSSYMLVGLEMLSEFGLCLRALFGVILIVTCCPVTCCFRIFCLESGDRVGKTKLLHSLGWRYFI